MTYLKLLSTQTPASLPMTVLYTDSSDQMQILQEDLEAVEKWEKLWQMQFHPEKCQVIRISHHKHSERQTEYKLHGHTLEGVDSGKYLGVNISHDLSWHTHVDATADKVIRLQRSGIDTIKYHT